MPAICGGRIPGTICLKFFELNNLPVGVSPLGGGSLVGAELQIEQSVGGRPKILNQQLNFDTVY